jgi:sigma-E factor negative regulatory protein RseB
MMRRQLGFLLLLGLPLWSWAESPEAAELIARMSEAVRTLTYSGTVVYSSDARMETLRVLHEYRNGEVRERLTAMTGDAREIYRNNEEVICVLPEQKIITVDRRAHQAASLLPSLRKDNIAAMADRYRFEPLGQKRIAGRSCQGVRVSPRDDMRYGYEYWLDIETNLPLRVVVLAPDGERIEEMMFTDIAFSDGFEDARFERAPASEGYRVIRHADESPRLRVPARWSLREPPPGFRKISHSVRKGADDRVPVEHFLFSDGIATISIYGANAADGQLRDMAPHSSRMGALNVASRIIDGHQVTVVGEVPADTVQWVVERLQLEPSQGDTAAAFEPLPVPSAKAADD